MSEIKRTSNPVMDILLSRRSVRKYSHKAVETELLEAVLAAGLYAPTGGNHQYTRFIVIQNKEVLEAINHIVQESFAKKQVVDGCYQNKTIIKAKRDGYHCMYHAPVLIVAVSPANHGNSMADSANALQNMQIAAASMNLGACWINQLHWLTDDLKLREYLGVMGMKDEEAVFGSLALGYPDNGIRATTEARPARKAGRIVMI